MNLFSLRATDPAQLRAAADPVGPHTDEFLRTYLGRAGEVVAVWGVHGDLLGRADVVLAELARSGIAVRCLGTTKHGQPRHPLYVKTSTPLVDYPVQF